MGEKTLNTILCMIVPQCLQNFWNYVQVEYLGGSRHENVVSLYGYCEDEEHLGLVYEYMEGGNLEDRLKNGL